jgi:hypothetical protein
VAAQGGGAVARRGVVRVGTTTTLRRQLVVGNHIVDFACTKVRLVVEVDGDYHEARTRQVRRAARGWGRRTSMLGASGLPWRPESGGRGWGERGRVEMHGMDSVREGTVWGDFQRLFGDLSWRIFFPFTWQGEWWRWRR